MSLEHLDLFIHASEFLASQGTMNTHPQGETYGSPQNTSKGLLLGNFHSLLITSLHMTAWYIRHITVIILIDVSELIGTRTTTHHPIGLYHLEHRPSNFRTIQCRGSS
jgi:hypothetical protein